MRWQGRRGSSNIEDRRRKPMRGGAGGLGITGLLIVLALGYFFGVDVTPLLQGQGGAPSQQGTVELTEADQRAGQFVSFCSAPLKSTFAASISPHRTKP